MRPARDDLASLWLPLLGRLTERFPRWTIWKNVDAALHGDGDVDSAAPAADHDAIVAETRAWAERNGLGDVVACRHVAGVLFIAALDPDRPTFFELDVNARKYFRGSIMFRAEDLPPLAEVDTRGFRRLRPGAEGLILFLQNSVAWGGRPNHDGRAVHARVAPLLSADPEGVARAAEVFKLPAGAVRRSTDAFLDGGWDRPSVLALEGAAVARAVASPRVLASRLEAKRVKRSCPILRSIFIDDRRLPENRARWLADVRATHPEVAHG